MATRPVVSPRCVAFIAFPLSKTCPLWIKTNWTLLFTTPVVFSLLLSRPPCTRTSSSRGAGTSTAPQSCNRLYSVLPCHHLYRPQSPSNLTAHMELHHIHKLPPPTSNLSLNPIFISNNTVKLFQTVRLNRTWADRARTRCTGHVRGSCRLVQFCSWSSATQRTET